MALFDRYIAVDWSAAGTPRMGADSIWIGEWGNAVGSELGPAPPPDPLPSRVRGRLAPSLNLPTRTSAMVHLARRLRQSLDAGERVFVGCDFGFGYPAGTAGALTGAPDWQGLWHLIADLMLDGDDNANNRFEVAEALNRRLGEPLFWGHPHQHSYTHLTPRRPLHGYRTIAERRAVEALAPSVQPMFKLAGIGAVGSQSLTGIARLQHLRSDPSLAGQIAVWPFETGFAGPVSRPIWLVEIYPSLFPLTFDGPLPKDRAQVEAAARGFAELDRQGRLAECLTPSTSLADDLRRTALAEEGWIAGAGHVALLGSLAEAA